MGTRRIQAVILVVLVLAVPVSTARTYVLTVDPHRVTVPPGQTVPYHLDLHVEIACSTDPGHVQLFANSTSGSGWSLQPGDLQVDWDRNGEGNWTIDRRIRVEVRASEDASGPVDDPVQWTLLGQSSPQKCSWPQTMARMVVHVPAPDDGTVDRTPSTDLPAVVALTALALAVALRSRLKRR